VFYLVLISDFFFALLFTRSKRLATYHVVHCVFERPLRPVRFIYLLKLKFNIISIRNKLTLIFSSALLVHTDSSTFPPRDADVPCWMPTAG